MSMYHGTINQDHNGLNPPVESWSKWKCSECGCIADETDCDVLGADFGKVFCPNCRKEVFVISIGCDFAKDENK